MFFGIVALGYIPGVTNAQGQLFGLFVIELKGAPDNRQRRLQRPGLWQP